MVQEEESRLWGFLAKHVAFVFLQKVLTNRERDYASLK